MKKLFLVALAAVGLASCVQNEELAVAGSTTAIAFGDSFVYNATKAEDPTTTTTSINNFDVWAFMDNVGGTVLEDEDVTKVNGVWGYTNLQYWAPNHTYYFAALSPANSANVTEDLAEGEAAKLGLGEITFTNVDGTEDLLYAKAKETTGTMAELAANGKQPVVMQFQHLLSKVKFTFQNGFATNNMKVAVTNVRMSAPKSATIDLAVADYSKGWVLGTEAIELDFDHVAAGAQLEAGSQASTDNYRLTIPASSAYEYTVTFDVVVYSGTVEAFSETNKQATIKGYELAMGKAYNFTAVINADSFGLQPIEFTAEVDEWGTENEQGSEWFGPSVATRTELQAAIDNAKAGETTTIYLTQDIDLGTTRAAEGYVTRVENGSNIVIDGLGHTLKGGIRIVGQSKAQNETTVIRNINFETAQSDVDFIASSNFGFGDNFWRYANNVTIENCTFTAPVSEDPSVVGIRFNQAYNITVKNCEGTNLHSLCQFQSNDTAIVLEGLKAVNCKNGISLGTTKQVTINGLEINAQEYGLRLDGNSLQSGTRCSLSVENATITAMQPIIARKVTAGYDLTLGENVVLNASELHQVIFTTTSDDVRPYVAPAEGKYTFNSAADYIVFPGVENADVKVAEGLYYVNNTKTYLVANAEGLIAASAKTIKGGESVALVANIDLAGKTYNGLNAFNPETNNTFDGRNHIVSNWTYTGRADDMGFIKNWVGPIKNLTVKNAVLRTGGRSAVIAAKPYGNIENCHVVDCNLQSGWWACGLIAGMHNSGNMKNCTATGSYIKSTGGTAAITGVLNEAGGVRTYEGCVATGCTINNGGDDPYTGAAIIGLVNLDNATVKLIGCDKVNNTCQGTTKDALVGYSEGNTIVVE